MRDRKTVVRYLEKLAPKTVVHLAASRDAGASVEAAGIDWNTVQCTSALLDAVKGLGCRIVHVGSYKQYGNAALPFREDTPPRPTTQYGMSKQISEWMILASAESGECLATCLRLGPVFGPNQPDVQLIPCLVSCLRGLRNDPMPVGTKVWDPVYVDDAVDAILRAATTPQTIGRVLNVSSGRPTTPADIARLLGIQLGLTAEQTAKRAPQSDGIGWSCLGDPSLMHRLTGWKPTVSLEAGLTRIVARAEESRT